MAFNTIATQQENATERTAMLVTHMLNYCATFTDAILTYDASDMILHIQSDASFLSEPKAKSRGGGYFYLSNNTESPTEAKHNGPIYCFCQVLKNVLSSAAEAEMSAMFENVMQETIIQTILTDLQHKQPPTPVRTDNSTALRIVNDTIKQVRSRTMDMRFHFVRDRMLQGQFYIYWDKGENNIGDYYTKQHPPWHQYNMRPVVLNNPLDTKYYSGKGVLVVPRRGPKPRPKTMASKQEQASKVQSKVLRTYLVKPVTTIT